MIEDDTLDGMSYTEYMHFYICQKMLENTHSRSLLWIMHSGPFYFHSLGKMQMARHIIWNLLNKRGKQSDCTHMPELPALNPSH